MLALIRQIQYNTWCTTFTGRHFKTMWLKLLSYVVFLQCINLVYTTPNQDVTTLFQMFQRQQAQLEMILEHCMTFTSFQ